MAVLGRPSVSQASSQGVWRMVRPVGWGGALGAFAPPFSTEKASFKIIVQAGHSNAVEKHTIAIPLNQF